MSDDKSANVFSPTIDSRSSKDSFNQISGGKPQVQETMNIETTESCNFEKETHEISVDHVERHATPFQPVDSQWQFDKCRLQNLQLGLHDPILAAEFKEIAGAPKEIKKNER